MLDDEFSEEVRRLKPRKVRFSRHVERLLGSAASRHMDDNCPPRPALRPESGSQNSICCAACGQTEYLSRSYCRCGHYLHGQLEDEYLAWERDLRGMYDIIARDADRKLKPLRWLMLVAMPFVVGPMLYAFISTTPSLTTFLWWLPGFAIVGGATLADKFIARHKAESAAVLENADFETFLLVRNV